MIGNKYERLPQTGDSENEADQHVFYLAPLPLPTGTKPFSSRNLQKHSNDTYMDFALGSASFEFAVRTVTALLCGFTLFIFLIGLFLGTYSHINFGRPIFENIYILFFSHWFIPSFLLGASILYGGPIAWEIFLSIRTPPIRFNRQRREVAYVAKRGQVPRIVPWESVIACISSTSITKYDNQQKHALMICLRDPNDGQVVWLTIASYNAASAMSEWEAIRVYMEEGPDNRSKYFDFSDMEVEEGTVAYFQQCRHVYRRDNGYLMYLFGFVFLQALGGWTLPCHITAWIQRLPRTSFPRSIREWSKPLPKEQWQQPSAELVEQSKEVQKILRRGKTLVGYFTELSKPPSDPKPSSLTGKRKQRKQARLKLQE